MNSALFFTACIIVAFLLVVGLNIIQRRRGWGFGGRVGAGVAYWRGQVFGGGAVAQKRGGAVNLEKVSAAQGGFVAKSAAFDGLAVGLPGHTEAGGGFNIDREAAAHQVNESIHHRAFLNPPRGRVVVTRRGAFVQGVLPLCQRVVDGSSKGESISFMPLLAGAIMFVQSVRSRAGRVVVSADQLRVVLRVRVAGGWRGRVAAFCAGYLA